MPIQFLHARQYTTIIIGQVVINWSTVMTEGLFDRYFCLLAGRLPAAEYGVIADSEKDAFTEADSMEGTTPECLC
jgi:hypothetical protein